VNPGDLVVLERGNPLNTAPFTLYNEPAYLSLFDGPHVTVPEGQLAMILEIREVEFGQMCRILTPLGIGWANMAWLGQL